MPELVDQYFLVDRRDVTFVNQFLDKYLPERQPTSHEYSIGDNEYVSASDIEWVMSFYEYHPTEIQYIYFKNLDKSSLITHAILTYTDDGKMILGISAIGTFDDLRVNLKIHQDIKLFLNASITCMTLEEQPPDNSVEFIEFAKGRSNYDGPWA